MFIKLVAEFVCGFMKKITNTFVQQNKTSLLMEFLKVFWYELYVSLYCYVCNFASLKDCVSVCKIISVCGSILDIFITLHLHHKLNKFELILRWKIKKNICNSLGNFKHARVPFGGGGIWKVLNCLKIPSLFPHLHVKFVKNLCIEKKTKMQYLQPIVSVDSLL